MPGKQLGDDVSRCLPVDIWNRINQSIHPRTHIVASTMTSSSFDLKYLKTPNSNKYMSLLEKHVQQAGHHLAVCVSVFLSVCLSVCLYVCMYVYMCMCQSVSLSVYLSFCMYVYYSQEVPRRHVCYGFEM